MTLHELMKAMEARGLAMEIPPEGAAGAAVASNWMVRVLLGIMGWLGGLMVLGFFAIFVQGLLDSIPGLAVLSVSLFIGAYAIYRRAPHHDFANQAALAASICAQALAMVLFFKIAGNSATARVALLVAAMQLGLVWLMPNYLHRLVSMLFAVIALFVAAERGQWTALVCLMVAGSFVALSFSESRWIAGGQVDRVEPAWAGLALGLLGAGAAHATQIDRTVLLPSTIWTGAALGLVLLGDCAANLMEVPLRDRLLGGLAALVFVAAAFGAPGLIACALVLLSAFRSGRKVYVGLALVALLGTLVAFYYQLDATLLKKSGVLALCGVTMLAAWGVHRWAYPCAKEPT